MRPFRFAAVSVCLMCGLVLVTGCASRRSSARNTGRVFYNVTPPSGSEYNPPAEPTPLTPPAPGILTRRLQPAVHRICLLLPPKTTSSPPSTQAGSAPSFDHSQTPSGPHPSRDNSWSCWISTRTDTFPPQLTVLKP